MWFDGDHKQHVNRSHEVKQKCGLNFATRNRRMGPRGFGAMHGTFSLDRGKGRLRHREMLIPTFLVFVSSLSFAILRQTSSWPDIGIKTSVDHKAFDSAPRVRSLWADSDDSSSRKAVYLVSFAPSIFHVLPRECLEKTRSYHITIALSGLSHCGTRDHLVLDQGFGASRSLT